MRHLASLLLVFGLYCAPMYAGAPEAKLYPFPIELLQAEVPSNMLAPELALALAADTASTPAPAAEAPAAAPAVAPAAAATTNELPAWLQALISVIGLAITAFLVPFLKRKAEAAKAEAKRQSAQATEHDINSRGILVSRLKQFLWGSAEAMAEKKFPELAAKIKNGELNGKEAIKKELYGWGGTLRDDAMSYFGNQGVDVVAAVGDDFLDKLIERAANKVSPFPGKETAKVLLQEHASDWLIEHGVDWVRQKYLDSTMRGVDVAPAPAEG